MKKIFILFLFLFISACGGGSSDAVNSALTDVATKQVEEGATAATNQLAADALARAEAEKLIRFGTGKFGQSTFQ
jgi:ornithine cyclodeaminase/alanine dehydrogenase-like protein (mu-crystallin family)